MVVQIEEQCTPKSAASCNHMTIISERAYWYLHTT
jgi:hypothetical protein